MFWTAFVWGAGVSLGASIGIIAFIVMHALLNDLLGFKSKSEAYREYIKAALSHRNELAMEANMHLAVIAEAHLDCDEDDDEYSDESWRG